MQINRVGREWLLKPIGIVFLKTAHVLHRGWQIAPGIIRIKRQEYIVADCISCRFNPGFLLARRQATDLHFDRLKAEFYKRLHLFT